MPLISVIVPVYKVEPYLRRCVDSILGQTFQDFELILVDDGSPDNSGRICDEYAEADSRVVVIHQKNGGLSAARNAGIDWAFANSDSEWLHFVDSDDWVHPQILEQLLDANIKNRTDVSICSYINASDINDKFFIKPSTPRLITAESYYSQFHGMSNTAWGKLWRKSTYSNIRFPVGKVSEDMFVSPLILFAQKQLSFIPNTYYAYFQGSESITRSAWTPRRLDCLKGYEFMLQFFYRNEYHNLFSSTINDYLGNAIYQLRQICRSTEYRHSSLYKKIIITKIIRTIEYCITKNISLRPVCKDHVELIIQKIRRFLP